MGQIERIISAVTNLFGAASLIKQSTAGGTEKLTIPGTPFQIAGTAQVCRCVSIVHSNTNPVYFQIGALADVNDFIIPKDVVIPVPIDNCSKLNFFGTENDTIQLLWRN